MGREGRTARRSEKRREGLVKLGQRCKGVNGKAGTSVLKERGAWGKKEGGMFGFEKALRKDLAPTLWTHTHEGTTAACTCRRGEERVGLSLVGIPEGPYRVI